MPLVEKTESLRPEMQKLTDEQLRDKTREFRKRLDEGETLDDLLPEAFASCSVKAAKRVLGMEHYRVQMIGGVILHQGRIAEMKTGEGKTLVSTLPAYLNALEGKGVHIVTVNDYLAKRDAEWMGKVHEFLGLTVGVVLNDMKPEERRGRCHNLHTASPAIRSRCWWMFPKAVDPVATHLWGNSASSMVSVDRFEWCADWWTAHRSPAGSVPGRILLHQLQLLVPEKVCGNSRNGNS